MEKKYKYYLIYEFRDDRMPNGDGIRWHIESYDEACKHIHKFIQIATSIQNALKCIHDQYKPQRYGESLVYVWQALFIKQFDTRTEAKTYKLTEKDRERIKKELKMTCPLIDESKEADDGWISVKDRLPEDLTECNIAYINTNPAPYYEHIKNKMQTGCAVYFGGKWYWYGPCTKDYLAEYQECYPDRLNAALEVIYWMPIPDPPKEEK